MIKLHELKVYKGSRKTRKVVGRGLGSGHGTYSGRGAKGQNARKSGGVRPGFEGGRQPMIRQAPKLRGFKSPHKKSITVLTSSLNKFANDEKVTNESLFEKGIIKVLAPVKIVLKGELKKKLEVMVAVSAGAKAAIEKAGGKITKRS
ncbi:MAG: ribosomal protein [Candidatus Doudnabacteria bacterium]|nr:ribosomal protein [Candidatus Doudnabacteria bacterium]